jgi:glutamine amidotransferase-like uncharacterized protein
MKLRIFLFLFFGLTIVSLLCVVCFVCGVVFGNAQAYENRFQAETSNVSKAIADLSYSNKIEIVKASKGNAVLVGSLSEYELELLRKQLSKRLDDKLLSGIHVINKNGEADLEAEKVSGADGTAE